MQIRAAIEADLDDIRAIYNDVIATTTAAYRDEPVNADERLAWFKARRAAGFPVLVAVRAREVLGFAAYGDFRHGSCYRRTVELTVHVKAGERGKGIGGALVEALVAKAGADGKHTIVASIDADNAPSIRLFKRLGFVEVAHFREVGFKFGRWLDLVFLERVL